MPRLDPTKLYQVKRIVQSALCKVSGHVVTLHPSVAGFCRQRDCSRKAPVGASVTAVCLLWSGLAVCALLASAQNSGRFDDAKRTGLAYVMNELFDRGAGRLEEVWEQDQSDPLVAEYLAVAYFNAEDLASRDRLAPKAEQLVRKSLALGGKATFLIHHSHERLAWLQGREYHNFCSGVLSIGKDTIAYVGKKGDKASQHSFQLARAAAAGVEPIEKDRFGAVRLTVHGEKQVYFPRSRNPAEGNLILAVLREVEEQGGGR